MTTSSGPWIEIARRVRAALSVAAVTAAALLILSTDARAAGATRARSGSPNAFANFDKLDPDLAKRVQQRTSSQKATVIVELQDGQSLPDGFRKYVRKNPLGIINGQVLDVPEAELAQLAASASVVRVHVDRPAFKFNYRTSITTGTRVVQETLGLTGAGIGVVVIDSGITTWHDDLTNDSAKNYPYGNQRVSAFVDFVNGRPLPYDDDGHGTHVAGIIAGNGYDSAGQKAGAAPDASLIGLKVLDANGAGTVSNIIAALDWVLANRKRYNIRVVNLSVGATIRESFWTDPLTLAAKRVVDAGVVVVTAAGNFGTNDDGQPQYGGITAPGNAPWVLTVGASSTNGTVWRRDDVMAMFSSRGPTFLDWVAKPDLVAPGVGTVSLADPTSTLFQTLPGALVAGTISTSALPYLSLSGTSMAAPVVAGTVALMLQANPDLTPNAVKAILQYTAQQYPDYDPLTEGAGFLNSVGAVRLARFYASRRPHQPVPVQSIWSGSIIWGSYQLSGGVLDVDANAFRLGTTWGSAQALNGDQIVWGTARDNDQIVWGTARDADQIVWGTARNGDQIVWGTARNGDQIVWGTASNVRNVVWGDDCDGSDCDGVIWGTRADGDQVWGTARNGDQIVWGTARDADQIVWGTARDADQIVWGTARDADQIVWGTAFNGDQIVWGTARDADQIVWGTARDADQIVWGTALNGDQIVWGTFGSLKVLWIDEAGTRAKLSGGAVFDRFTDLQLLQWIQFASMPPPTGGNGRSSTQGNGGR